MNITLAPEEVENLFLDVWFSVDSIIHDGIELAGCKQESRRAYLKSSILSRSYSVHATFETLKRLGLLSIVLKLRDMLRSRLGRDRYGYEHKVDVFAFSNIQDFFV